MYIFTNPKILNALFCIIKIGVVARNSGSEIKNNRTETFCIVLHKILQQKQQPFLKTC